MKSLGWYSQRKMIISVFSWKISELIISPWSFTFQTYFELFRNFPANDLGWVRGESTYRLNLRSSIFCESLSFCNASFRFWLGDRYPHVLNYLTCLVAACVQRYLVDLLATTHPFQSLSGCWKPCHHWTLCPSIFFNKSIWYYKLFINTFPSYLSRSFSFYCLALFQLKMFEAVNFLPYFQRKLFSF